MEIVEPIMSNCTFTFDLQIPLGMDSAGVTVTNTAIWVNFSRSAGMEWRCEVYVDSRKIEDVTKAGRPTDEDAAYYAMEAIRKLPNLGVTSVR